MHGDVQRDGLVEAMFIGSKKRTLLKGLSLEQAPRRSRQLPNNNIYGALKTAAFAAYFRTAQKSNSACKVPAKDFMTAT